jgi:hypothetical protein
MFQRGNSFRTQAGRNKALALSDLAAVAGSREKSAGGIVRDFDGRRAAAAVVRVVVMAILAPDYSPYLL